MSTKLRFKKTIHITIWSIFFLRGITEFFELFYVELNQLALILIFCLFLQTLLHKTKAPLSFIVFLLAGITYISGSILNHYSAIANFYFFRILILPQYLYLIVIINEKDDRIIHAVIKTILFFFALQIPANFIKFALVGVCESHIGTISYREGSVTTIVTLVGISFAFAKYLLKKEKKFLLLILLFLIFSQIGEKRAVIVYVPVLLVIMYLYYAKISKIRLVNFFKLSIYITVLSLLMLYIGLRLNPNLNPEGKVGGRLDVDYAIGHISYYINQGEYNLENMSRIHAMRYLVLYLIKQDPMIFLFGEGAGKLTYAANKNSDGNFMYENYGIRYGARTGILWIFMQTGIVGVTLYLVLLIRMLLFVHRIKPYSYHHLVFLGIWITVIIDLFTYSMVSLRYFVINGVFFTYFGLFYRDRKMGHNVLSII